MGRWWKVLSVHFYELRFMDTDLTYISMGARWLPGFDRIWWGLSDFHGNKKENSAWSDNNSSMQLQHLLPIPTPLLCFKPFPLPFLTYVNCLLSPLSCPILLACNSDRLLMESKVGSGHNVQRHLLHSLLPPLPPFSHLIFYAAAIYGIMSLRWTSL